MNSLNRDIEKGEKVVLKKNVLSPKYWDIKERTVIVLGGFGMLAKTSGTAIYVRFESDGEECRFEGYEIDKFDTELLQSK